MTGEPSEREEGEPSELEEVARVMREYRLDSVEMPSGLKVLKTTHAPLEETLSPEAEDEAVARRLEALGFVNASGDSGRVPVDQDEVLFAASRAPAMSLDDFRPAMPGAQEPSDADNE